MLWITKSSRDSPNHYRKPNERVSVSRFPGGRRMRLAGDAYELGT